MKCFPSFLTSRRSKHFLAVVACTLPGLRAVVHALTVGIGGNPAAPTPWPIDTEYDITVSATPTSNPSSKVDHVNLWEAPGNASGPTQAFAYKYTWGSGNPGFSHICGASVLHTFHVENEVHHYWAWWQGEAQEFICNGGAVPGVFTSGYGYYYTS